LGFGKNLRACSAIQDWLENLEDLKVKLRTASGYFVSDENTRKH